MIFKNFIYLRTSQKFIIRCFSSKVKLHVNPLKCLQDEPIHIAASNLAPSSNVTLVSMIKDHKGSSFLTNTHYRTDSNGTIDLSKHPSLDGSYKGVFPMGPIAALHPDQSSKYIRFWKKDVAAPLVVTFTLLKGHINEDEALNPDPNLVLDSVKHERIYLTEKTTRIPVRDGRLRGTLFIPEGEGPFPGVIDLYGSGGGLAEHRSAQLAARGIASLALAFFGFEDLPKEMNEIDLSYFEEGIDYLHSHPKIKKNGIGTLGISKGGDIACTMATYSQKVKAVVCMNGVPVNTICPLKLKDRVIPNLKYSAEGVKIIGPDLISILELMSDSDDQPDCHIPLHKAEAEFLFICSKEDKNWRTEIETEKAVARMKANGKTDYKILKYEGAGHLLDPPYGPLTIASYHKVARTNVIWGGNAADHSVAQVDSWKRIIEFFKRVL